MSCLIIKNDGIGDLIIVSGIIAELSRIFDGKVDLITCEQNIEIAENIFGIRNHLYVSRDNLRFRFLNSIFPTVKGIDEDTIKFLQLTKYQYVICLRRYIRESTLILMKSAIAEHKYCAWQFPTNTSFDIAKMSSNGWIHYSGPLHIVSEINYYQGFIEEIFQTKINPYPRLICADAITQSPVPKNVGICIGGNSSKYSIEYWIEILTKLNQDNWHIFLFGGVEVTQLAAQITQSVNIEKNLVGSLTLIDSIPYLERISFLIGNDTGFTHFASLIVPKCLIILGGGTFSRFFPWTNTPNQYVIYHSLDCFDCDWRCRHKTKQCLDLIQSSEVIRYFYDIINSDKIEKIRNLNPVEIQYQVGYMRLKEKSLRLRIKPHGHIDNNIDNFAQSRNYAKRINIGIKEKYLLILRIFISSMSSMPSRIFRFIMIKIIRILEIFLSKKTVDQIITSIKKIIHTNLKPLP